MTVFEILKLALTLYWGFMKDSPIIGTILTLCSFSYMVSGVRALRGRRTIVASTPNQPSPQPRSPVARMRAAPVEVQPAPAPQPEGPSRLDRLMNDDN